MSKFKKSPQKRSFVRTIRNKIQEKFEKFWLRFVGEIFAHIGSNVNENEKKKKNASAYA